MDIISHSLTGIAVGTLMASFSKKKAKQKAAIIFIGGLGGALPDLDAISLWSGFDASIGSFFGLEHSGKQIYFGKFWYSHHAALHSLIAPILLVLLSIIISLVLRRNIGLPVLFNQVRRRILPILAFFFGFLFHLFEDMPTPASVWGGVNFFFPSDQYIGGFGKIWWWNNYDLVLIIVSIILLNSLINLAPNTYRALKIKGASFIFLLGFLLSIYQINSRSIDFSYTGHSTDYNKFEKQSKLIQKEILGESLYQFMNDLDNKIPLNF